MQRIMGDKLPLSVKRSTIYTLPEDKAIGVASKLFQSPRRRLGALSSESATDAVRSGIEFGTPNVAVINFERAPDEVGVQLDRYRHAYFRNARAVSSDLVLMLRDDLDAGPRGQPLDHIGLKFWQIPPGYPDGKTVD